VEETVAALDLAVRQGKALYAGISNYDPDQTRSAMAVFKRLGTPCVIHQDAYSMFNRRPEEGLLELLAEEKTGCIVFSPLAQGLLTDKYLDGIPRGSRASKGVFLKPEHVTEEKIAKVKALGKIAEGRGQSVAQLALAWVLRHDGVVSALVGARSVRQLEDNVAAVNGPGLSKDELAAIDAVLLNRPA
jgi:L-glyceraldehyde 3-phosphate reductase